MDRRVVGHLQGPQPFDHTIEAGEGAGRLTMPLPLPDHFFDQRLALI